MDKQEPLTSEQRLEIIEQMISTAKGNITDNSFQFLLWGWVVIMANLGQYLLMGYSSFPHPEMIWLICFPTGIVSWIYGYNKSKTARVRNYTDRISVKIWLVCIIGIATVIAFGAKINFMIIPLIMLITGFSTYLSGIIIKFKPLILGGVSFWLASILSFLTALEYQNLIAAAALVLGYLIPGYLLKAKNKNG